MHANHHEFTAITLIFKSCNLEIFPSISIAFAHGWINNDFKYEWKPESNFSWRLVYFHEYGNEIEVLRRSQFVRLSYNAALWAALIAALVADKWNIEQNIKSTSQDDQYTIDSTTQTKS